MVSKAWNAWDEFELRLGTQEEVEREALLDRAFGTTGPPRGTPVRPESWRALIRDWWRSRRARSRGHF